jgi:hypothetical protein
MGILSKIFKKVPNTKYEIKLADTSTIGSDHIEYMDKGIKIKNGEANSYRFIPYDAILWADFNDVAPKIKFDSMMMDVK